VLRLDPDARRVVVGPRSALAETRLSLNEVNWLCPPATFGVAVAAKLRSAHLPVPATLYPGTSAGEAELVLAAPAGAVTPGQAAVLYDGERLIAGGWIQRRKAAAA
jgi:tRNA-specific 2-thiouridylase